MRNTNTALIGDIQKFSTQDGPGIRSTVFLKGCPLRCVWCHNPELISPGQQMILSPSRCIGCMACVEACPAGAVTVGAEDPSDGVRPFIDFRKCSACGKCAAVCYAKAINPVATGMSVQEILEKVLEDKGFYEESGGGVTISGGELLLHCDFVQELIRACAEEGIDVCLDTCGYGDAEKLKALAEMPNVSWILYDLKHMDSARHEEYTGKDNKLIFDNLKMLTEDAKTHDKLWIRMPLIRGVNDTEDEIQAALALLLALGIQKVSLLAYHEMGLAKARNTGEHCEAFEAPSEERLDQIRTLFEQAGIDADVNGRKEKI